MAIINRDNSLGQLTTRFPVRPTVSFFLEFKSVGMSYYFQAFFFFVCVYIFFVPYNKYSRQCCV